MTDIELQPELSTRKRKERARLKWRLDDRERWLSIAHQHFGDPVSLFAHDRLNARNADARRRRDLQSIAGAYLKTKASGATTYTMAVGDRGIAEADSALTHSRSLQRSLCHAY